MEMNSRARNTELIWTDTGDVDDSLCCEAESQPNIHKTGHKSPGYHLAYDTWFFRLIVDNEQ